MGRWSRACVVEVFGERLEDVESGRCIAFVNIICTG